MSTKTIAEKLQIKPNTTVWLSDGAQRKLIEPLPEGVRFADSPEQATTTLMFVDSAAALRELLSTHQQQLVQSGTVWIAYPKANRADINRNSLWPIVAEYGMRPNGQVAVNGVWSALRFRANRADETPFTGGR